MPNDKVLGFMILDLFRNSGFGFCYYRLRWNGLSHHPMGHAQAVNDLPFHRLLVVLVVLVLIGISTIITKKNRSGWAYPDPNEDF